LGVASPRGSGGTTAAIDGDAALPHRHPGGLRRPKSSHESIPQGSWHNTCGVATRPKRVRQSTIGWDCHLYRLSWHQICGPVLISLHDASKGVRLHPSRTTIHGGNQKDPNCLASGTLAVSHEFRWRIRSKEGNPPNPLCLSGIRTPLYPDTGTRPYPANKPALPHLLGCKGWIDWKCARSGPEVEGGKVAAQCLFWATKQYD
jgi:hypothetical protein